MIATILILSLAFYWLGLETDWLRIRLEMGETLDQYDKRILTTMESKYTPEEELAYQEWLKKRYEPKYKWGAPADNQIDPRYKWMVIEEDLEKRRNREMIYQRG